VAIDAQPALNAVEVYCLGISEAARLQCLRSAVEALQVRSTCRSLVMWRGSSRRCGSQSERAVLLQPHVPAQSAGEGINEEGMRFRHRGDELDLVAQGDGARYRMREQHKPRACTFGIEHRGQGLRQAPQFLPCAGNRFGSAQVRFCGDTNGRWAISPVEELERSIGAQVHVEVRTPDGHALVGLLEAEVIEAQLVVLHREQLKLPCRGDKPEQLPVPLQDCQDRCQLGEHHRTPRCCGRFHWHHPGNTERLLQP
jgi:hypothetical protein